MKVDKAAVRLLFVKIHEVLDVKATAQFLKLLVARTPCCPKQLAQLVLTSVKVGDNKAVV